MSFPKYPEYKDSGVEWLGEVPAHWTVRRLRYTAAVNPPKSEVRTLPEDMAVTFLPMEALGEAGSLDLTEQRALGEVIDGYTYLSEGDVAYAKITPCFENGKVALVRGALNRIAFGTTEVTVLRPLHQRTTSEYLLRVVSSEPFRVSGEASMYGAGGQKRVPDDHARDFTIAWPPLIEQRQISYFLDHETARIDALIEEQQRLIELLKEKRQAVISHAVTKGLDPDVPMKDSGFEAIGAVPSHWEIQPLRSVMDRKRIIVGSRWDKFKLLSLTKSGVIERDVSENFGKFPGSFEAYQKVEVNDLVMCLFDIDETPRTVGLSKMEGMITGAYTVFTFRSLEVGDYLYFLFLHLDDVKGLRPYYSGLRKTIRSSSLLGMRMPIPPKEEARELSRYIKKTENRIDSLIAEAQENISLLQERRSALISAAVTGKIDVRDWTPPDASAEPEHEHEGAAT
ncbi:MAG: restriction endonuclease subunit S [Halorhodospira sp.]